jgi:hypothetical protein
MRQYLRVAAAALPRVAAQVQLSGLDDEDDEDQGREDEGLADEVEPPVPAGLRQLSDSLASVAKFLGIDDNLIATAAKASGPLAQVTDDGIGLGHGTAGQREGQVPHEHAPVPRLACQPQPPAESRDRSSSSSSGRSPIRSRGGRRAFAGTPAAASQPSAAAAMSPSDRALHDVLPGRTWAYPQ